MEIKRETTKKTKCVRERVLGACKGWSKREDYLRTGIEKKGRNKLLPCVVCVCLW